MSRSARLFEHAQRLMPGGVNSPVRAFRAVGGIPPFVERGQGAWIHDVDGRRYVDYVCSWGPLILGHAHPRVIAALQEALRRGTSFGATTEVELELAELLRRHIPSLELVRMTNSGTEATMSALRLARAYTGRKLVVKFEGCYHGHADALLVKAGSGAATLGTPSSAGVPPETAGLTAVLPYNDLEAAQRLFAERGEEIAAVIVEPVAGNMGVVPPREGFLQGLQRLCERHGALFVLDEVITGFRLCLGGAQNLMGLRPDLTCLGKIIGGGLPVGAFGGRREVMERLAPLGPVYQAGTLAGNPLAMTAGRETLRVLEEERPYERLEQRTAWLCQQMQEIARRRGVPLRVQRVGSMFTPFCTEQPVWDWAGASRCDLQRFAALFRGLLAEGVYPPPSQFESWFLSTAHEEEHLELTLKAFRRALEALP